MAANKILSVHEISDTIASLIVDKDVTGDHALVLVNGDPTKFMNCVGKTINVKRKFKIIKKCNVPTNLKQKFPSAGSNIVLFVCKLI